MGAREDGLVVSPWMCWRGVRSDQASEGEKEKQRESRKETVCKVLRQSSRRSSRVSGKGSELAESMNLPQVVFYVVCNMVIIHYTVFAIELNVIDIEIFRQ